MSDTDEFRQIIFIDPVDPFIIQNTDNLHMHCGIRNFPFVQITGNGSLIIGIIDDVMRGEKKDYFAKLLKFPDNHEFAIAVAVGHRATEKEPHEIDFDKSVSFI